MSIYSQYLEIKMSGYVEKLLSSSDKTFHILQLRFSKHRFNIFPVFPLMLMYFISENPRGESWSNSFTRYWRFVYIILLADLSDGFVGKRSVCHRQLISIVEVYHISQPFFMNYGAFPCKKMPKLLYNVTTGAFLVTTSQLSCSEILSLHMDFSVILF